MTSKQYEKHMYKSSKEKAPTDSDNAQTPIEIKYMTSTKTMVEPLTKRMSPNATAIPHPNHAQDMPKG